MKGTSHEAHSNGRRTEKSPITVSSSEKILTKTKYIENNEDRESNLKRSKLIDLKIMHYYIINVYCTAFQMPRWPQFNGTWISIQFFMPFCTQISYDDHWISYGFMFSDCYPALVIILLYGPKRSSYLTFSFLTCSSPDWGGEDVMRGGSENSGSVRVSGWESDPPWPLPPPPAPPPELSSLNLSDMAPGKKMISRLK